MGLDARLRLIELIFWVFDLNRRFILQPLKHPLNIIRHEGLANLFLGLFKVLLLAFGMLSHLDHMPSEIRLDRLTHFPCFQGKSRLFKFRHHAPTAKRTQTPPLGSAWPSRFFL